MTKYSQASVFECVEKFFQENGRAPRIDEMSPRCGMPTISTFRRLTGITPYQYIQQEHGLNSNQPKKAKKGQQKKRKKRDEIIREYQTFFQKYNRLPTPAECRILRLVYPATFRSIVGITPGAYFRGENPNTAETVSEAIQYRPLIAEFMERLGISQEELAEKTGLDIQTIQMLSVRKASDNYQKLYAIAKALNVPMEVLYSGKS